MGFETLKHNNVNPFMSGVIHAEQSTVVLIAIAIPAAVGIKGLIVIHEGQRLVAVCVRRSRGRLPERLGATSTVQ